MGTGVAGGGRGRYSRDESSQAVKLTTHLILMPGFRISGSTPPLLIRLQGMYVIDMTSFSCYSLSSCNFSIVGRNSTLVPKGSSVE